MKRPNAEKSQAIQIFIPELPDTPGWVALSYEKQQALVEHASRIQQNRQLKMLGEFGELMELRQVEELIEGEEIKMVDVLRKIYPDISIRTIFRRQEKFREFTKSIPPAVLRRMSSISAEAMSRFERIANAALGDIRNAIRALPALPAPSDKAAEQYLEKLDEKLSEHRQLRSRGRPVTQTEEITVKFIANAIIAYTRKTKLKTSAEKKRLFKLAFGYAMEAEGIPGKLTVERTPIPDGILIRRGRPIGSKTRRKETA